MSSQQLNRHIIREYAFQALFAYNANPEGNIDEIIQDVLNQHELHAEDEAEVPTFLTDLVYGVINHQKDLDESIGQNLKKGWSTDRIAKTDLIILRIAIFEINYEDDIDNKVAINEALNLAKTFSDDESRKFINAVLSSYADLD